MSDPEYKFKICLLGEPGVGKTSCVYRFIENKFRQEYKSTLGVNLLKKDIKLEEKGVSLQIWDLGGQESFKSLRKLYLEGADGAIVLFDLTNKKSFEKLGEWIKDFKDYRKNAPLILLGNKSDLKAQIVVSEEEGIDYAKENEMEFLKASAKTGENVEEAFKSLTKKMLD